MLLFLVLGLNAQQQMPDATVNDLDENPIEVADYCVGKMTAIVFWASYNTPSQALLDAIKDQYSDWSIQFNLQVLAISVDNYRALKPMKEMVMEKGWPFMMLHGKDTKMSKKFDFEKVPHIVLVDDFGKVLWTKNSYVPGGESELEDQLFELWKKKQEEEKANSNIED